ncbi:MAG: hypothetical protein WCI63_02690 [bacterium]
MKSEKTEPVQAITNKKTETFWDPLGSNISPLDLEDISTRNGKLEKKFSKIKSNPSAIKRNVFLLSLLGIVIFALIELIYFYAKQKSGDALSTDAVVVPLICAIVPVSIYLYSIKELQKDLLNLSVADRFNWLYDPDKNRSKWKNLKETYPEIFDLGNENQYIDNQFWGLFDDTERNFWLGRFNYTVSQGKTSQTYQNLVYGYKLSKPVTTDFSLIPQTSFTKAETALSTKVITTESSEFNRLFHINYKGDRGLVGADILQVLDPDTIVKLIDYNKDSKKISMVFRGDIVLFSTRGDIKTKYTKIRSGTFLDERDAALILEQIHSAINLTEEVLSSIDGFNKR